MTTDSRLAFKLFDDVATAADEAKPSGTRGPFNPIQFMESLHKRGWVIVRQPTTEEVSDARKD
jgi:hypothetical protein